MTKKSYAQFWHQIRRYIFPRKNFKKTERNLLERKALAVSLVKLCDGYVCPVTLLTSSSKGVPRKYRRQYGCDEYANAIDNCPLYPDTYGKIHWHYKSDET
jgi:hypothetical protein